MGVMDNPIADRTARLRDPLQQLRRSRTDTQSLELIEHQFDDDHVTLSELVLHDEVLVLRRIAVGVLVAFVGWTYVYGVVEMGWDFTNATFFGAMTLTTVGYGELVPRNHFQRIVTTYYMWICVAIAATALSFVAAVAMDDKSEAISSALRSLEYCGAPTAEADERESDVRSANETGRAYLLGTRTLRRRRVAVRVARRRIKFALLFAVGVLLLGALVMLFLEPAWDYFDCVYWATETMTTIGYGDMIPATKAGKWWAILFMFVGTMSIANFAADLLSFADMIKHRVEQEHTLAKFKRGAGGAGAELAEFAPAGVDALSPRRDSVIAHLKTVFEGDGGGGFKARRMPHIPSSDNLGTIVEDAPAPAPPGVEASSPAAHIGRYEFLVYTLLLLGKVEASDVLDINDLFRALDKESLGDLESDVMPALRSVSSAILLEQESQDLSTPPPQSADAEDPWAIGMIV